MEENRKDRTEQERIPQAQEPKTGSRERRTIQIIGIGILVLLGLLYWWVSQG